MKVELGLPAACNAKQERCRETVVWRWKLVGGFLLGWRQHGDTIPGFLCYAIWGGWRDLADQFFFLKASDLRLRETGPHNLLAACAAGLAV